MTVKDKTVYASPRDIESLANLARNYPQALGGFNDYNFSCGTRMRLESLPEAERYKFADELVAMRYEKSSIGRLFDWLLNGRLSRSYRNKLLKEMEKDGIIKRK